tara:strand:+ start:19 stop:456 length:438 start_codon:yes stop_codon:yes gene_type:complete
MKARMMTEEDQKAVAEMVENAYVLKDEVKGHAGDAAKIERIKNEILSNTELPVAVANPDLEKAEMAIPYNTPPKEVKLHKKPLKVLMAEREHLRQRFTPRDGGMGGIPLSVRNRIERLEKVINIKLKTIQRAIEANESGSTSEES